jgi:nicotinic acid phosphoribosyltransferase
MFFAFAYCCSFFFLLQVLEILGDKFGVETNGKGFKLLPSFLRIIQGDGISYETLGAILDNMKKHNWSAENVAFGSGGALLQRMDRDTQKCAFKCSYAVIDGKEVGAASMVQHFAKWCNVFYFPSEAGNYYFRLRA